MALEVQYLHFKILKFPLIGGIMKSPGWHNIIYFPARSARVYRDWEHTHPNLRNHRTLNLNCFCTAYTNGKCRHLFRVIPVSVTLLRWCLLVGTQKRVDFDHLIIPGYGVRLEWHPQGIWFDCLMWWTLCFIVILYDYDVFFLGGLCHHWHDSPRTYGNINM